MGRPAFSILGLIIFLIIVVGVGILIYRFVVSDNTEAATVVINDDGDFALDEYQLKNDEVFQVRNDSNENQTIKKGSDDSTLVEVNANSTSRELSLSDDSANELYLAGDESKKTVLRVGSPSEQTNTADTDNPPSATPPPAGTSLPDTGPLNNLIFVALSLVGFALYKASKRVLS